VSASGCLHNSPVRLHTRGQQTHGVALRVHACKQVVLVKCWMIVVLRWFLQDAGQARLLEPQSSYAQRK